MNMLNRNALVRAQFLAFVTSAPCDRVAVEDANHFAI
jgi:hypothetical protein